MPEALIWEHMTVKEVRDAMEAGMRTVLVRWVTEQHGYHPLRTDCYNCEDRPPRCREDRPSLRRPSPTPTRAAELPGPSTSARTWSRRWWWNTAFALPAGPAQHHPRPGHGGSENDRATQEAAEIFLRNNPQFHDRNIAVYRFWVDSETCRRAFEDGDFHSGWFETSMLLFWAPDQVRDEKSVSMSPRSCG